MSETRDMSLRVKALELAIEVGQGASADTLVQAAQSFYDFMRDTSQPGPEEHDEDTR